MGEHRLRAELVFIATDERHQEVFNGSGDLVARINVDDGLFKDNRFMELVIKTGGLENALGALVHAWIVAQKYWFPNRQPIPKTVWKAQRLNDAILEAGMAEDMGEGYRLIGSEEQFLWLFNAAKAGNASAESKKKSGNAVKRRSRAVQPVSTSSSFLSSPISISNSNTPLPPKGLQAIWNAHCGKLPQAETLNRDRERQAKARLAERGDPAYWEGIVKAIAANPFCRGENDRGWVATFDYLLRPKTHVSVSERMKASPQKIIADDEAAYQAELAQLRREAEEDARARGLI